MYSSQSVLGTHYEYILSAVLRVISIFAKVVTPATNMADVDPILVPLTEQIPPQPHQLSSNLGEIIKKLYFLVWWKAR
jgi:hypothetical protein